MTHLQNRRPRSASKGRPFVPFIRKSTVEFLTRGETKAVQCVALQLHFGMVNATADGAGAIQATWKEIGAWAGVSYASAKRAAVRLRELGWIRELSGHQIVFDYSRSLPKKAQIEPHSNGVIEPSRKDEKHPIPTVPTVALPAPPSGEDGALGGPPGARAKEPSVFSEAVAVIVAAGADRAGAVAAVKEARRKGSLDLGTVQRIAAAVAALPSKPFRPGGLVCDAVKRPELGKKLIREASAARCGTAWGPSKPAPGGKAATDAAGELVRLWRHLEANRPSDQSASYLGHMDREAQAKREAVTALEARIQNPDALKSQIAADLVARGMKPDTLVWRRALSIRWAQAVMEFAGA